MHLELHVWLEQLSPPICTHHTNSYLACNRKTKSTVQCIYFFSTEVQIRALQWFGIEGENITQTAQKHSTASAATVWRSCAFSYTQRCTWRFKETPKEDLNHLSPFQSWLPQVSSMEDVFKYDWNSSTNMCLFFPAGWLAAVLEKCFIIEKGYRRIWEGS